MKVNEERRSRLVWGNLWDRSDDVIKGADFSEMETALMTLKIFNKEAFVGKWRKVVQVVGPEKFVRPFRGVMSAA